MKSFLSLAALACLLSGCSNYFSDYRTVYRIETTTGERYYSNDEPHFDDKNNLYHIEDLDGNHYDFEKTRIYNIEKFKHKK